MKKNTKKSTALGCHDRLQVTDCEKSKSENVHNTYKNALRVIFLDGIVWSFDTENVLQVSRKCLQ